MEPRVQIGSELTVAGFTGTVTGISLANGVTLTSKNGKVKRFSFAEIEKSVL
jgi:hypothetical protein